MRPGHMCSVPQQVEAGELGLEPIMTLSPSVCQTASVWGAGVNDPMTAPSLGLTLSIRSGLDSSAKEGLPTLLAPKSQGWGWEDGPQE